jgi:hypothetical protein
VTKPALPSIDAGHDEWLVYADQLQSLGDPRGELITLNHSVASGSAPRARDEFVRTNAEKLLGAAGKRIDAMRLGWRWMWIDTAEVVAQRDEDAAAVAALLESPACGNLRALTIAGDPKSENDKIDLSPALAAVASRGLPASCRALSLVDQRAARSTSVIATFYDPPNNLVDFGPLGPLWPKLQHLKHLHVSVSDSMQVDWGEIASTSLVSFRVDSLTSGGRDEIPEAFDRASWPNLEELSLRLPESWTSSIPDDANGYTRPYEDRDEDEYGEDDPYHDDFDWSRRLGELLESLKRTKLKRLALTSFASAAGVLLAIRDTGLPDSVVELDFSDSSFGDQEAEELLQDQSLIRRVKRLVLERVPASKESLEPIRARGIEVVHSEGMGATYRFLVGME